MRLKYHFDALAAIDRQEGRNDASGLNAFFSNQLEQVRPQLYEKKYPEFKGRRLVPIKNDIHPGAMQYTERGVDEVGEADYVTDLADDIPTVEVVKDAEDTYYMRMIALKYGWGLQEARNAQFAGMSLDTRKAFACRKGIERFIDKKLLIGGTALGRTLYGLFTLSGAFAPTTFTDDFGGGAFKDQSSDDLYRNLMDCAIKGYNDSHEIETPDTLVLPTTLKGVLMNRRMGDSNNSSVLKFFLESNDFIKNVETSHFLEANGGHGGGAAARIVMYRKDSEILEGLVNEFEQLPPEYKAMRVETTCIARVGGIAARRPKAITYWDVQV